MIVKHNLTAMNANRMLGITASAQAKAVEKLSSGYRVNRAADDAAGLAISEKMRKQIRGLSQAVLNAQDGISMVQTADGALNEVQEMLQRMNELAVKAANGTMSESDRKAIQDEVDQLVLEVDRVAVTTKFNETYLMNGAYGATSGLSKWAYNYTKMADWNSTPYYNDWSTGTMAVSLGSGSVGLGSEQLTASGYDRAFEAWGTALSPAGSGADIYYVTIKEVKYVPSGPNPAPPSLTPSVQDAISAYNSFKDTPPNPPDPDWKPKVYKAFASEEAMVAAFRADHGQYVKSTSIWKADDGNRYLNVVIFPDATEPIYRGLHVGADSDEGNSLGVNIANLNATGLGVNGLRVSDEEKATAAIDVIADALEKVSAQRASLGAVQNRLEHTINNLNNIIENTVAAESQIRDTDMAKQMVEYAKYQILAQAGQTMLAQSNQFNQGVLSLLG